MLKFKAVLPLRGDNLVLLENELISVFNLDNSTATSAKAEISTFFFSIFLSSLFCFGAVSASTKLSTI